MLNLVMKDIIVQKKSIAFAVLYIFFFIVAFQSVGEMTFTCAITAFSYILVMGGFAYDDKNKADIMLNSLPLKRYNIVLAKYISLLTLLFQTLNLKSVTSPSFITYSFPSERTSPCSFAALYEPALINSSYEITSARIKPRSKSLWIFPAA